MLLTYERSNRIVTVHTIKLQKEIEETTYRVLTSLFLVTLSSLSTAIVNSGDDAKDFRV